uniref:Reverse transcriptase Ty1/copia-type domain-containing protein n=1 Tax=Solanum lycopersicum TaxID=4081 RepID=A0A3Q7EXK9_SOLLC
MLIAGSSMREINNLKTRLPAAFEIKDLDPAKQIFGMKISRDRSAGTLNLSQELYIEKVLSRFRVNDAKSRTIPLANHFKLSKEQSPKTAEERNVTLQGFVDSDLGGDVDSSKSTSGKKMDAKPYHRRPARGRKIIAIIQCSCVHKYVGKI